MIATAPSSSTVRTIGAKSRFRGRSVILTCRHVPSASVDFFAVVAFDRVTLATFGIALGA